MAFTPTVSNISDGSQVQFIISDGCFQQGFGSLLFVTSSVELVKSYYFGWTKELSIIIGVY